MIKDTIKLQLKNGLEPRAAALFVQLASKYDCHITMCVGEKHVNAKSIMGMMSLGNLKGASLAITLDGDDEAEALAALTEFVSAEELPN
jgi:catabolite repression HPr-like protein/phosphocarrier protein